ncbi:hypothetical protein [Chromobacterium haemolyticum]|uniref:hypothetical protein n=1 Tax=Chromobacterium haemolyticum TaxID=394935 RepID=UPI00244C90FF|nr:hypothetical protein [Chromobacterium haemolyticum]MDH0342071.1 hypothetical protein [Chromobacterium haemolyticum]
MDTQRALRELEQIKLTGPKPSDLVASIAGITSLVLGLVFGVGFCLRLLEIHSIFDRILASWLVWHYATAAIVCYAVATMMAKRIAARMNRTRR